MLCPDPPLEQEETLLDDGIEVDDSEDEDCFMVTGDIDADKGSDEEGPDEEDAGILDVEETPVVWTIAHDDKAAQRKRAAYTGTSRMNVYRKNKKNQEAAKRTVSLHVLARD
jgi:hypothetical protein